MYIDRNILRKLYQQQTVNFIKKYIKDSELVDALTPTYPLGAKRVLFSDTYYPALAQPNVELVTGGVKTISKDGIVAIDGSEKKLDIIVYATGFKTNPFLMGLKIKGKNGVSIQDHWKDEPKNYLGITVNNFPNLFMMYGPNTNLGHNSIIVMSEAQANYIAQCIQALIEKNWKSMEVKEKVLEAYYISTQERLKNMIWSTIENSWYKSANGNIPNNYPGRTMEYISKTKKVNFAVYQIT